MPENEDIQNALQELTDIFYGRAGATFQPEISRVREPADRIASNSEPVTDVIDVRGRIFFSTITRNPVGVISSVNPDGTVNLHNSLVNLRFVEANLGTTEEVEDALRNDGRLQSNLIAVLRSIEQEASQNVPSRLNDRINTSGAVYNPINLATEPIISVGDVSVNLRDIQAMKDRITKLENALSEYLGEKERVKEEERKIHV